MVGTCSSSSLRPCTVERTASHQPESCLIELCAIDDEAALVGIGPTMFASEANYCRFRTLRLPYLVNQSSPLNLQ